MTDFTIAQLKDELTKLASAEQGTEDPNLEELIEELEYNKNEIYTIFEDQLVKYVDSFGGEGQGDEYWVVFSVGQGDTKRLFNTPGWYASYEGSELQVDDIFEVVAKEVVKIEYVKV